MTNRPDRNCLTVANGDCITVGVCMHSDPAMLTDDEIIDYDDLVNSHEMAIRDRLKESDEDQDEAISKLIEGGEI